MTIYNTLKTKPHNPHYLAKYCRFIEWCRNANVGYDDYMEQHHIAPKAKDLFPEYTKIKLHPWNEIYLTPRQHFICHWMLWKVYGGSQTFAFKAMVNGQKSKYQEKRYNKINSKTYESIRKEVLIKITETNSHMSTYVNLNGDKVRCRNDDERVLSGELISIVKGRKFKRRTPEQCAAQSIRLRETERSKNRKKLLYFLTYRISVLYNNPIFIEYLNQGWVMNCTKEYRQMKRDIRGFVPWTEDAKKSARESRSNKIRKITSPWSMETRINSRYSDSRDWNIYVYNYLTKNFEYVDLLLIESHHIKVFSRGNGCKTIWDIEGNRKLLNVGIPVPVGYFSTYPTEQVTVFDINTQCIYFIQYKDKKESQIIIRSPNGGRIKFGIVGMEKNIYLNQEFIDEYGIPFNCTRNFKVQVSHMQ